MKRFVAALLCCLLLLASVPAPSFANADDVPAPAAVLVASITVAAPTNDTPETTDDGVLAVDGTLDLTAAVQPENADNPGVAWTSSNESVATVDAETGRVTGVAAGEATIAATARDNSGVSGEITLTVTAAVPATPPEPSGAAANSASLTEPANPAPSADTTEPTDATPPANTTDPTDITPPAGSGTPETVPESAPAPTLTVSGKDGATTLPAGGTLQMLGTVCRRSC